MMARALNKTTTEKSGGRSPASCPAPPEERKPISSQTSFPIIEHWKHYVNSVMRVVQWLAVFLSCTPPHPSPIPDSTRIIYVGLHLSTSTLLPPQDLCPYITSIPQCPITTAPHHLNTSIPFNLHTSIPSPEY